MNQFKTEQENFWASEFGNDYIKRNQGAGLLASNINFFVDALKNAQGIKNCLEFGANIGMNLRALKQLYPLIEMQGIEINTEAANQLSSFLGEENVYRQSILEFAPLPPPPKMGSRIN